MVLLNPTLPSSQELPCSDETPVDNEIQNYIPNLLLTILGSIWKERSDWFFAVDMGIYYLLEGVRQPVIVPDGFLSLGVQRQKNNSLRLSYVLWEENGTPPVWVLEIVSKTYNREYEEKMTRYSELGVLYYIIYNPDYWQRDGHKPFEVYRLIQGKYVLQQGEPFWMPELGLGIGREFGNYTGCEREWLYWYDREGNRYPTPEENRDLQQQRADRQQQRADRQQERADRQQERAERAEQQIEQEKQRAEQEKQRAEQAELELEKNETFKQQAISKLVKSGFSAEQVADFLSLSLSEVRKAMKNE